MKRVVGTTPPYYFYLALVVVLIIGVVGTIFISDLASRNIKFSLLNKSQGIAEIVPAASVNLLSGDKTDLENPAYQSLKRQLTSIRDANEGIRSVYLMGLNNGKEAFFYVDSEDQSSKNYSPPGQAYPQGDKYVVRQYTYKNDEILPIKGDRWGTSLSAFSPVNDPDTNEVAAVLGIDMPASTYYFQLASNVAVFVLLIVILLMVIYLSYRRMRQQQQYLAEKAFLLSFASHEIRSPLTSVSWALEWLASGKAPAPTVTIQRVQENIKRILGTIEDLLALQRTESLTDKELEKVPTNIYEFVNSSMQDTHLLQAEHGVHIKNITSPQNQSLTVPIDVGIFKRTLSFLLLNAIKYAPVTSNVEVVVLQDSHSWMVQIHNEGVGIPKELQAGIFNGKNQKKTKPGERKGTGLGLILAHDLIERHGGKLTLESEPNKGATFRIIMPKSKT